MTPSTYLERRWPDSPVFQDIARHWCEDQSRLLLELVWRGYDRLLTQDLSVTAFSDTDEAKEESLNFLLCLQINHCMTGDEPCCAYTPAARADEAEAWAWAISAARYRVHAL